MMKIDSIESLSISTNKKGRGRLVRSLEFTNSASSKTKPSHRSISTTKSKPNSKPQPLNSSIWRDPLKNVLPQSTGFTTHKMSSVTNNFMSSDGNDNFDLDGPETETENRTESSDVEEIVEDLDPGRGALVFLEHDQVFRTSPLSSSNSFDNLYINNNINNDNDYLSCDPNVSNDNDNYLPDFYTTNTDTGTIIKYTDSNNSFGEIGMSWNPKQNRWVPLIYRYVFLSSAFSVSTKSFRNNSRNDENTNNNFVNKKVTWNLKREKENNNNTLKNTSTSTSTSSFKFPPPQKSIMMGPDGLLLNSEMEAREACEKLLDLIDDKNLMLPVQFHQNNNNRYDDDDDNNNNNTEHSIITKTSKQSFSSSNPPIIPITNNTSGRSVLSEWSSLPSSPPPPIFHDVCNRPIPELRLSPPMTGKSLGKRLFQTANISTNSPCESPLTKRLRFSSSSSSIS